jgi:chromosome segregation ATPase
MDDATRLRAELQSVNDEFYSVLEDYRSIESKIEELHYEMNRSEGSCDYYHIIDDLNDDLSDLDSELARLDEYRNEIKNTMEQRGITA